MKKKKKARSTFSLNKTLLRDIFTKDSKELQQSILISIHYLNELEDKQTGLEYLDTMMHYIFGVDTSLTDFEKDRIIKGIGTIYPEGRELTMSFINKWREEGIEKGIEIGKASVLSETVIKLLTGKFDTVPQDMKDAIAKADSVTLQLILSNIFSYETIEDVRKYI